MTDIESNSKPGYSNQKDNHFLIVGIGASAGGVTALRTFFDHVPADSNIAYVVILHLSPNHDSQLASVLSSVAKIPVTQILERTKVEPNQVYVVPPNQHLEMLDGEIIVSPNLQLNDRRAPVDIFFRTLAESHKSHAVAVILSGTGANGSMGLKRVKENGGTVFVQNPREAEYSDMPRNAIATELVDEILGVADIPQKIIAYKEHIGTVNIPVTQQSLEEEQQAALRDIFTQLRVRTGHDFSNYKRATILRRIERRINVRGLSSLAAYSLFLNETPEEAQALLKDLLISVTNFFRDREAFLHLETNIIPRLIHNKKPDEPLRIWIAGCATGEEAYTIAMLLAEATDGIKELPLIQIFATDIDETAIATAREGWYTLNDAADVSPDRLRRFFTPERDGFCIKKSLRENILFAVHNVIKDPPFSRLDMITCRNLLIYLNSTAQNRVMETFHFALRPGNYLFLGSSESVDGANDLFVPVNKQFQIFQSREAARRTVPFPDSTYTSTFRNKPPETDKPETKVKTEQENRAIERLSIGDLHQRLLEQYAPPSVVVNENNEVIHISEKAGRFMQVAGGEPTTDILKLIRPELRLELRTALYQSVQKGINIEIKNLTVQTNGHNELIHLHVRPVLRPDDTARGFILIVFETSQDKDEIGAVEIFPAEAETIVQHLEEEISSLKAQLRSSNEQFEVQTEELKASNEELQAMNEELRSAAEELETGKEELQSINEELITVNQELKVKVDEISHANNDFQNLINSTDIGTIFLDRNLRVKMFTPAARQIFNLIVADLGRPLSDITGKLEYDELENDVTLVMEKLQVTEREVQVTGGNTYLIQISPYRTAEDHINGVVISIVNITKRKQAEEDLLSSYKRTNEILESVSDAFYAVDTNFNFTYVNKKAEELWERNRESLLGKNLWTEFPDSVGTHSYATHVSAMQHKQAVHYETVSAVLHRWLEISLYPTSNGMSCYFRDITDRKEMNDALRNSEERLRLALEAGNIGTCDWNLETGEMKWNDTRFSIYGLEPTPDKMMHMADIDAIIHPDDKDAVKENLFKNLSAEGKHSEKYRVIHPDNSIRWIFETGRVVEWKDGKPLRVISVLLDNTEEITAVEELRLSEERYRAIYSQATAGVSELDLDGNFISVNQSFCNTLGYTVEELLTMNTQDITYPDDYLLCKELMQKASEPGSGSYANEKRLVCKNGSLVWVSESITGIRTDDKVTSIVAVCIDINTRKKAEVELHDSEERYRIALEAGELATWDWNIFTDKVVWNKQHFRLFGIDHTEPTISPEYFLEFIYPEDLAYVKKELMEVLGDRGIYSAEFRIRRRDNGKLRWMNGYGRVTERNEDGKPMRVSGVMFDTTDRREAEDNLAATQNSLNTALEAAKMGVWTMDMTHGSVDRSVKHDELLGFSEWQEDWSKEKAKTFIIEEDKPKFDLAHSNLVADGIFELEARVKQTDGNICWIYYYGRAFEGEDGKTNQAAGVIFDISDRKTVEKQKDEFIGIASHELKTPVTSIKAYAEILQEMFTDKNDFVSADLMSKLDSQVDRLTKLIRDLLDVTKVSEGQLHLTTQSFSIENMTKNVVEEMQRTTRQHRIKLTVTSLPEVVGDEERLGQVLTNLLSNAIKYSPESKDVLINTSYNDNKVSISVQDFGIGMSPGTLEKLFARFFRSDNPSVRSFPGLGLGLFISMEIMKRHGGSISVSSERNKGSIFTMTLPFA